MPSLSAEEFWELLASAGLVEPAVVTALRQAFATRPGAAVADSRSIAAWLAETGVLTRWQARRLGNGDRGPFAIGDYRLLERHDAPGSALLFTARHQPSGNAVSLVRLDPQACRRSEVWETVVRRTEVAHRMSDPTLSRTWALEQIGIHPLIVCERIDGEPLASELERRGPLPLAEAGATALRIAAAVAELHVAGEVHGSLSLDTVLRPRDGAPGSPAVRVLQFPLADDPLRLPQRPPIDTAEEIAKLGRRAAFVAPELTLPGSVCDRRSDVYAIGCILHALVTGRLPGWSGDPRATLGDAVTVGLPVLAPPVPAEVGTLVGYLAARDPAGRYPTAVDAAAAIATCFGLPWTPPEARESRVAPAPFVVESQGVNSGRPDIPSVMKPALKPTTPRRESARSPGPQRRAPGIDAGERPVDAEAWFWKLMAWMFGLFFAVITALTIAWVVRSWNSAGSNPAPSSPELRATTGADLPLQLPVKPTPRGADGSDRGPKPETIPSPSPSAGEPAIPATTVEPAAPPSGAARAPGPSGMPVVVPDAAGLPWVSPTHGAPPSLVYLPSGAQLVLVARPADLAGDDEGARLLEALGPDVKAALDAAAALCGGAVHDIELVQAAWQANAAGTVTAGSVIRLVPGRTVPDDAGFRSRAWGVSGTRAIAGATVHAGRLRGAEAAFWLPERERGRVLVIAPPDHIEAIVAATAGPEVFGTVLPPPLEMLRGMLDETRHVTLFGMPYFLFTSGRGLVAGPLAPLAVPLAGFLGDDVQAAAVSLHVGDDTYAEIDVVAPRDVPVARLAPRLVTDLQRMPDAVEDVCAGLAPGAYGRKLVQRLPGMLRVLVANLRAAGEGGGVVLNVRLPRHAGHNIALAAELALAQSPAAGLVAATPVPAVPAREDARAKLQRRITLSFASDTLEKSIQMVAEEIGVPMEILGGDLELEGITKNQSFGLAEVERPAEAVLRTILAKANPDGKLVYVIRNRDGVETIEITTRAAAQKRGDPVPPIDGPS